MKDIQFDDFETLESMISEDFGEWSKPVIIDQKMIDLFAELTGDHQWIHVDVSRAKRDSPFADTIAHGFLLLGLSTVIKNSTGYRIVGHNNALNYGLDGVRFVSAVPAGSQLHGHTRLRSVEQTKGGVMLTVGVALHVVGVERPAVVFDWKLFYQG